MIRPVADCRLGIRVDWDINNDLAQKLSFLVEYLNAVIATVCDINISQRV
jgi:hypothetical protein